MESQVELKMNIGEAAKKSNLSVKTVRFYSDIGLINPNTNETIDRLKRIILNVGLNLERLGLNSSNNSGLAKLF